jgi:hypothetical protein
MKTHLGAAITCQSDFSSAGKVMIRRRRALITAAELFPGHANEHCGGPKTDGNYVHSPVLTDIASGRTECVAMPVRNQLLVVQGMTRVAADLPFVMLGVDTDNDNAFMNERVYEYCKGLGLEQTRSRAYKKNDQAWI